MDDIEIILASAKTYPCLVCNVPAGVSCKMTSADLLENPRLVVHEHRRFIASVHALIFYNKGLGLPVAHLELLLDMYPKSFTKRQTEIADDLFEVLKNSGSLRPNSHHA